MKKNIKEVKQSYLKMLYGFLSSNKTSNGNFRYYNVQIADINGGSFFKDNGISGDKRKQMIAYLRDKLQVISYCNKSYEEGKRYRTYQIKFDRFNKLAEELGMTERLYYKTESDKFYLDNYDIDFRTYTGKERPPGAVSDAEYRREFKRRYKQLDEAENIIDELNDKYYENGSLMISRLFMRLNTERNKSYTFVKKHSLRMWSDFCGTPSTENNKPHEKSRQEILTGLFGAQHYKWDCHDVVGSVPRIAHLIETGEVLPPDADPYQIMGEIDGFPCDKETHRGNRQLFKRIVVSTHFGENRSWTKDLPDYLDKIGRPELKEFIPIWKDNVEKFCGVNPNKNTRVFMDESIIYLKVMKRFLDRGIWMALAYDSFYYKIGETNDEEIDRIIEEESIAYVAEYY